MDNQLAFPFFLSLPLWFGFCVFFFCARPYLFESLWLGFSVFLLLNFFWFLVLLLLLLIVILFFIVFTVIFLHLLLIIRLIIMLHILLLLTTIHLHLLYLYLLLLPLLLMLLLTHKPNSKRKQTGKTDRFDDWWKAFQHPGFSCSSHEARDPPKNRQEISYIK